MAGIGFELKRLFSKKSITSKLAGVFHSVFSTVGHMLIIVLLLVVIHFMLLNVGIGYYYKELFSCGVLYAFVFPLIFSSGISIVMSRYLADNIYAEQYDKLLPSMFGALAFYILLAAPAGLIYYVFSPADLWFKVGAYMLYIETGIIFVLMTFISAVKKYKQVSFSFFTGITLTGIASYFIIYSDLSDLNKVRYLIWAFAAGMGIVLAGLLLAIRKRYYLRSSNYFDFLLYLKKYPVLFWYNTVYTLGLYVHNFIFWIYPSTRNTVATYIYSMEYDMATFLGVLTILPATVFFVVGMETSVYEYYKAYISAVNNSTSEAVAKAKNDLETNIWREYIQIIEVQVVISLLFIVIGMGTMPLIGMSSQILEMYPFLACGYFFSFMMFLTTTLLMYFESYADALKVSVLFLVSNIIFTTMTVFMGSDFYGVGLIASGGISFIGAFDCLRKTIKRVDYIMFCSAMLNESEKTTRFERFVARLDGKSI